MIDSIDVENIYKEIPKYKDESWCFCKDNYIKIFTPDY